MRQLRQSFLDTPGGQIYYWTAGEGPAIFCIHQSGNSSDEYRGLIPHLSSGFRLIALDLPGHGRSDDTPSEPTVDDYTDACQLVLDALDVGHSHLLGHHGGCLTAMNLNALEPERFGKAIMSGLGGPRSEEENAAFRAKILGTDTTIRAEPDWMGAAWERYLGMASAGAKPKDTLRPFIAFLDARLRPYRGIVANLDWDRGDAMEKLTGPVLLLDGERDHFIERQEMLLDTLPQATRQVIPGGGAFVFYEKPAECAAIIREYLG